MAPNVDRETLLRRIKETVHRIAGAWGCTTGFGLESGGADGRDQYPHDRRDHSGCRQPRRERADDADVPAGAGRA
jgi:hypothetical protein